MICQRGISDNGIQRCADIMGHIGQEKCFRFTGLFRGRQLRLKLLILLDPVKCTPDEKKHNEDENTPAEKDARHNEIRLPEKPDNQIPCEKHDQQHDRNIKQLLLLIPVSVFPDISRETYITVYVVSHQRASGIYHQIYENVIHNASCFTTVYFLVYSTLLLYIIYVHEERRLVDIGDRPLCYNHITFRELPETLALLISLHMADYQQGSLIIRII